MDGNRVIGVISLERSSRENKHVHMADMDIDTAELRSSMPATPTSVQQRLEGWSPSPATGRGAEIKQESASSRRSELFGAKAATLAKHNDTVRTHGRHLRGLCFKPK